jgi:hypothetical protein
MQTEIPSKRYIFTLEENTTPKTKAELQHNKSGQAFLDRPRFRARKKIQFLREIRSSHFYVAQTYARFTPIFYQLRNLGPVRTAVFGICLFLALPFGLLRRPTTCTANFVSNNSSPSPTTTAHNTTATTQGTWHFGGFCVVCVGLALIVYPCVVIGRCA